MPMIVLEMIVMETRNTPTAEKSGRQRAAIHNNMGNSQATGTTLSQDCSGSEIISPVTAASSTTAAVPLTDSLHDGGWRAASTSPITDGATKTIPIVSFCDTSSQVFSIGSPKLNLKTTAHPMATVAHAMTAETARATKCDSRSRRNSLPM